MNKRVVFLSLLPLIVLILAGSSPPAAGLARQDGIPPITLPVWRTELVAPGVALTEQGVPGMALDRQKRPHVVYGRTHLLHAWLDGATWRVEIVDATAGSISGPAIAVDDAGVLTIVACAVRCAQSPVQLTVYRKAPGGGWQKTPVAAPGLVSAPYLSLSLDSAGQPHVMAANKALVYAHLAPQGWTSERVALGVDAGGPLALAFDNQGRPAVLYEGGVGEYSQEVLWLGRKGAAGWTHEQITLGRWIGGKSLAFDAGGRVHAVFSDHYQPATVKYLHQTATGWQSSELTGEGRAPSLALDEAGRPHVVYAAYNGEWFSLIYAALGDTGWEDELVPVGYNHNGGSNTLLLDDDGFAHVISLNAGDSLQYATNRSGAWATQLVALNDPMGLRNALALDPADKPYLLYYRPMTQQLRWATRSGDAWTTGALADVAAEGLELALAIGPDGVPQAAFTDSAADALIVGQLIDGQWALEKVSTLGSNTALVVGSDNRPQLIQIEDGRVIYHTKAAGQWIAELVSDEKVEVDSAFLALDGANRPHVAYLGRMAVRQGADDWQHESLPVGDILAMTIGPDGSLYLLEERVEEMRSPPPPIYMFIVTLHERVGGEWSTTDLVNEFSPIGAATERLIAGAEGRVAVAYRDYLGATRCYQRDENGQWSESHVFDLEGDLGLAVGADDLPRLSGSRQGDALFLRRQIILLDKHLLLPVVPVKYPYW